MKNFNFTVLCLTVMTTVAFITDNGGIAVLLWAGYALIKFGD